MRVRFLEHKFNTMEGKLGRILVGVVMIPLAIYFFLNNLSIPNILLQLGKYSAEEQLYYVEGLLRETVYKNAIITSLISLLFIVIVVKYLNKVIIKPFNVMKCNIDKMSKQQKLDFIELKEPQEVMELASSFNEIVKSIFIEKQINEELQLRLEYDHLKTEFLGNVSHELRTPLNVILGTLQLLEMQNEGIHQDVRTTKHLRTMKQNCYRLLRLSNNIIDLTNIDSGFYEVNMDNYDIVDIVQNTTLSIADYVKNRNIKIKFFTNTKEKAILCDHDKIERILFNLLSNAIKCTNSGGEITVTIKEISDKIQIIVKDTGRGITEEKQKIIFDRFRQGEDLLTRSHEGSGLGLSLTKALIEMHEGTISLKSKPGEGSKFIIEIPVKPLLEDGRNKRNYRPIKVEVSQLEKINIEFSDINCN
ncbi:Signal transduction histidine kinase [Anaerovirgula multivorans]|uniref:histidine kinase n=1 Tax=Anaerovirgula multivorans TaxID=312168 RepID=A0A239GCU7_9FIRM|nr:HAMP domain-containing sensor histidine kinase [Anaerovirgula multivorans]SNS66987.1 Signal transduction histidine kinase [Anaerovirgula multivorans]